jgi:hypothetical protein
MLNSNNTRHKDYYILTKDTHKTFSHQYSVHKQNLNFNKQTKSFHIWPKVNNNLRSTIFDDIQFRKKIFACVRTKIDYILSFRYLILPRTDLIPFFIWSSIFLIWRVMTWHMYHANMTTKSYLNSLPIRIFVNFLL